MDTSEVPKLEVEALDGDGDIWLVDGGEGEKCDLSHGGAPLLPPPSGLNAGF